MIRRLLCLLGLHAWKIKYNYYCNAPSSCLSQSERCEDCTLYEVYTKECIYCGKVKK